MNKEELNNKIDNVSDKMKELGAKAIDRVDSIKLKREASKENLAEKKAEAKAKVEASKENFRAKIDEAKGKASEELAKAQNSIDEAKAKLAEKKEAHDKAQMEAYIDDVIEYAAACVELSMLAAEEADLAILEAIAAEQEYEELYGEEL